MGDMMTASVLATTWIPIHNWTWKFGIEGFEDPESLTTWSDVYVGPFSFHTDLSAPAVAVIGAGIVLLLIGGLAACIAKLKR